MAGVKGRSGRKPGTKNQKTIDLEAKLAKLNYDPITKLAIIGIEAESDATKAFEKHRDMLYDAIKRGFAEDKPLTRAQIIRLVNHAMPDMEKQRMACLDLAGKMAKELAQYVAPKRKAVEHTGPKGKPLPSSIVVVSK